MTIIYECNPGNPREPETDEEKNSVSVHYECGRRLPGGSGWGCTKKQGHAGNHVACTSDGRVCAVWNDGPEVEEKRSMTIETSERRIVLTGIYAPDITKAEAPELVLYAVSARAGKALALEFRDDVYTAAQLISALAKGDLTLYEAEEIVRALQAAFALEPKQEPVPKRVIDTNPDPFSAGDAEAPGVIWCVVKEGEVYGAYTSRKDAEAYQKVYAGDLCQFVSAEQCEGLVGQRVYEALDVDGKTTSIHATKEGAGKEAFENHDGYVAWSTIQE